MLVGEGRGWGKKLGLAQVLTSSVTLGEVPSPLGASAPHLCNRAASKPLCPAHFTDCGAFAKSAARALRSLWPQVSRGERVTLGAPGPRAEAALPASS